MSDQDPDVVIIARRCPPQLYSSTSSHAPDRSVHSAALEYVARLHLAGISVEQITNEHRGLWIDAHVRRIGSRGRAEENLEKAIDATCDRPASNHWLTWLQITPTDAHRRADPGSGDEVATLLAWAQEMAKEDGTFKLGGPTAARLLGRYHGDVPDDDGGKTMIDRAVRRKLFERLAEPKTRPTTYRLLWRPESDEPDHF